MKLNRFIKNSDYTAEKQSQSITLDLSVARTTVAGLGVVTRNVDVTVPAGIYFENVTMTTSLTGSIQFVGNLLDYNPSDYMYVITFSLAQVNSTTYRLSARIQNWDTASKTINAFTARAKVNLSISPF